MLSATRNVIDIDFEMASLVQELSAEAVEDRGAAALITTERLRRLEDEARCSGTSRQAFQKIASARRLLGDKAHFGPLNGPFLDG
ncbi:hypothetical protein [Methylobacterium sp. CM6247]